MTSSPEAPARHSLVGRHVVVVGLGGMGLPLARALQADGATVTACDRDAARIDGAGLPGVAVDITGEDAADEALRTLADRCGSPWALCVTAAVVGARVNVLAGTTADIRRLMEINFLGTVNVDRAAARLMIAAGQGGRIVNWSSVNAVGGTHGGSAYASSKAAVESFSRCLAVELAEHGITVNVIRPGSVDTPMINRLPEEQKEQDRARIPLGRWGTGQDIAHAARMLIDPAAGWITGSVITADGGMLAAAGRPDSYPRTPTREGVSR